MKSKPILSITTANIHDGKWNFADSLIDGSNLKIIPINEAAFCPAKELLDIYKQTRESMLEKCGLPISTATNYREK